MGPCLSQNQKVNQTLPKVETETPYNKVAVLVCKEETNDQLKINQMDAHLDGLICGD